MALLIIYILIALGFSFLCSVLEAVLLSVTPAFVAQLRDSRPKSGAKLEGLKNQVDRSLSSILSLNTMAHTVGAAGAGAQAQLLWGDEITAAASAVLTLLILVISEIIPKTLGARYWRQLAPMTAATLPVLIILMYPFVLLSEAITGMLSRGQGHAGHNKVSRDEIAALTQLGAEQGVLDESEGRILRNLFRLKSLRTEDIMTPRVVVCSVRDTATVGEIIDNSTAMRFSRIPLFSGTEDHVASYVLKDDVLLRAAKLGRDAPVEGLERKIMVVPEQLPLTALFEHFLQQHEHIGIVYDEYGGLAGVVTMEDVVETLLGLEIVDEADAVQDMRAMARARWFSRARRIGAAEPELLDALEERDATGPFKPSGA